MDIDTLAKEMRERALLINGNPHLTHEALKGLKLQRAKRGQLQRVEDFKKLYFNAGRWAGGARDHVAREAFHKMNEVEHAGI